MKPLVLFILIIAFIMTFGRKILRLFKKFSQLIIFFTEEDKRQIEGRVISFVKKERRSFVAGESHYRKHEYYLRVKDINDRKYNLFVTYKEDYAVLSCLCKKNNVASDKNNEEKRVSFLVDKSIIRGMYVFTGFYYTNP